MLSYRHLFHAGNFADVFKHVLLTRLLLALSRKDKPFCYLETHAGTGRYDLAHPWAQKNAEFRDGIARILERDDHPAALQPYLRVVAEHNPDGRLRCYPGSPCMAGALTRAGDRILLAELNESDCAALRSWARGDRRIGVHHIDGYQALRALLPPRERRGLVLVDSSFDRAGELTRIATALRGALRRFGHGVFAVWYPLLPAGELEVFQQSLRASGERQREVLKLELAIARERPGAGMHGCGLMVVNPPHGFASEAGPLLDWLWAALSTADEGGASVTWLSGPPSP